MATTPLSTPSPLPERAPGTMRACCSGSSETWLSDTSDSPLPVRRSRARRLLADAAIELIKKAGEDVEAMKFNTAIAAMMEFVNACFKGSHVTQGQAERFVIVLSPFAPHFAEGTYRYPPASCRNQPRRSPRQDVSHAHVPQRLRP